jgi:hypothetical protein
VRGGERRQEGEELALPLLDHQRGAHRGRRGRRRAPLHPRLRAGLALAPARLPAARLGELLRARVHRVRRLGECGHLRRPAQGPERQPQPRRRVPGDEEELAAAEGPGVRAPPLPLPRQREHEGHRHRQPPIQHPRQAAALLAVRQVRLQRVHSQRKVGLLADVGPRVLARRHGRRGRQPEPLRDGAGQGLGVAGSRGLPAAGPDGRSVPAPHHLQRPARQALARVPLALPAQQQPSGGEPVAELPGELQSLRPLGGAQRLAAPLRRPGVQPGVEGGLAAHGELEPRRGQRLVGAVRGREQRLPGLLGIRRGGAGLVPEPRHAHLEAELRGGDVGGAGDGGRQRGARHAGQRDVPLAAEQAARGVEADPARPGQEDLRPGVEVHHVPPHAPGLVGDHPLVGELDQVPGDEARRQAAGAQRGHEQRGGVAAAAPPLVEGLLGRPDARLLPDHVADLLVHPPVQLHHQRHGVAEAGQPGEEPVQQGAAGEGRVVASQGGLELRPQLLGVAEGGLLAAIVDEEVEGVHRPDVDRHLHPHRQLREARALGERDVGHVVPRRILLPAQLGRVGDPQRVGLDAGPGVGRRA